MQTNAIKAGFVRQLTKQHPDHQLVWHLIRNAGVVVSIRFTSRT